MSLNFLKYKFFLFVWTFWLHWVFVAACRLFSSCGERWLLFIAVASRCRPWALGVQASVVVAHRLQSAGSVVVVHGLSCSAACEIFPDKGSNPCPLHWQVDS